MAQSRERVLPIREQRGIREGFPQEVALKGALEDQAGGAGGEGHSRPGDGSLVWGSAGDGSENGAASCLAGAPRGGGLGERRAQKARKM